MTNNAIGFQYGMSYNIEVKGWHSRFNAIITAAIEFWGVSECTDSAAGINEMLSVLMVPHVSPVA
jgi:hypothetical protein